MTDLTSPASEFFAAQPLSAFLPAASGQVITVLASDSVATALATLAANNILCAPVFDETQPATAGWADRVLGVVDFLSLVSWVVAETDTLPTSFAELLKTHHKVHPTTVRALKGQGRWVPFVPLDPRVNTCLDAMLLLGHYGLHRVFEVRSPAGPLVNVLTQSAAVRLLNGWADEPALASIMAQPLGRVAVGPAPLVTVRDSARLVDAFRVLTEHFVSAVPVVDAQGHLVGTLSAKDLRAVVLNQELFAMLHSPVAWFPLLARHAHTCAPTDRVRDALARFEATGVHRLWLTTRVAAADAADAADAAEKIIGVVALRDILTAFVGAPPSGYFGHVFS